MSAFFFRHPGENDLALFAGGELGPMARWRIEGHLGECARCREAVTEFFELRSRVMDLAEAPQADWSTMSAAIHRRLDAERARPAPVWVGRPAWAGAAALVILVAAGLYVNYAMQTPAGRVSLDATAGSVELRVGDQQVLTLLSAPRQETQVSWRVSAGAVSARYVDADTGNITVNNVYAE